MQDESHSIALSRTQVVWLVSFFIALFYSFAIMCVQPQETGWQVFYGVIQGLLGVFALQALVAMVRENRGYRHYGNQVDPFRRVLLVVLVMIGGGLGALCGVFAGRLGGHMDWNGWQVFVLNLLTLGPALVGIQLAALTVPGVCYKRAAEHALRRGDRDRAQACAAISLGYDLEQPGAKRFAPAMRLLLGTLRLESDSVLAANDLAQVLEDPELKTVARERLQKACERIAAEQSEESSSGDTEAGSGGMLYFLLEEREFYEEQEVESLNRIAAEDFWPSVLLGLTLLYFFITGH